MKISPSTLAIRAPAALCPAAPQIRPFLLRQYATQTSLGTTPQGPKRKKVTAFNDDGHVPWSELSTGEKASRATQQSFNFGMIITGIVLTVRVPRIPLPPRDGAR
jgi:mitochondrial import inner membrane translocase subunit TIM21